MNILTIMNEKTYSGANFHKWICVYGRSAVAVIDKSVEFSCQRCNSVFSSLGRKPVEPAFVRIRSTGGLEKKK